MTVAANPTIPLYHQDHTLVFSSSVVAILGQEVALEATAFYPESGGQSADAGLLNGAGGQCLVTHVRKDKSTGIIWHACTGTLPKLAEVVQGQIDAATRHRHMQRHSAEHLLAAAFKQVNSVFTVAAVNMTSPECTLDLLGDPAPSHVQAAQTLLNETLARTQLTLQTPIVAEENLHLYPLRRETKVHGQVRLVIFADSQGQPFDVSACGGTHVPNASMVAPVVILRTERIKGNTTRVVFMAGEEASEYLGQVYQGSRALAQSFSVPIEKLTERIEGLLTERDTLKTELQQVRQDLALALIKGAKAEALVGHTVRFIEVPDAQLLAAVLTQPLPDEVVVALTPQGRCGVGSTIAAVDAAVVLRQALLKTGGKGGGKPDLAQGSTPTPQHFFNEIRQILAPVDTL